MSNEPMRFSNILELCKQFEAHYRYNPKTLKAVDNINKDIPGPRIIKSIKINFRDDTSMIFDLIDEKRFKETVGRSRRRFHLIKKPS